MSEACDSCLRRGALIGALSSRIQGAIGTPGKRVPGVLALSEGELLDALAGSGRPGLEMMLDRFDPAVARAGLARAGCEALCTHSSLYPRRLDELHDRPNPLYLRGGLARCGELLREPCVAIVGGRLCSQYAREVAAQLGRGLSAAGVTVVSGLARGIDGASHRGALEGGGNVLAVLGCGADVPYPSQHRRLYQEVVRRGAVLSELPPGTRPRPWSFPARNRIMAALAKIVVVVEAQERSGSLITAEFATDLERDLAAVPGQVTARIAAGSNALLREPGTTLVRHAGDVLDLLFGVGSHDGDAEPAVTIEPELQLVLDAVEVRDSLPLTGQRAGLSAGGLRAALGRLESLGLIAADGMGGYERCAGRPAITPT